MRLAPETVTRAWVALLACGHTTGDKTWDHPKREDYAHCRECEAGVMVKDVIVNEPETGPDGKR